MNETFPTDLLTDATVELNYNIKLFHQMGGAKWLKYQKIDYSQFSGEARKAPPDKFLKSIGYLIWCSSLYEVKIRRAIFWLECYIENTIVQLPGQRIGLSNNVSKLKRLLTDDKVINLLGESTITFFENSLDKASVSIQLRHDIIHGHHQGSWGAKNDIFRIPEKSFSREKSYIIRPTARKITIHSNRILQTAAIFALLDHLFDSVHNNW